MISRDTHWLSKFTAILCLLTSGAWGSAADGPVAKTDSPLDIGSRRELFVG